MSKPKTIKQVPLAVVNQMLSLTTAGFGLVSALAWNEVIKEVINVYIKPFLHANSGVASLTVYALVVTVLAVFITFQLAKIQALLTTPEKDKPTGKKKSRS